MGVNKVMVIANKITDADDEAYVEKQVGTENLLGFIYYDKQISLSDRENTSAYEASPVLKDSINQIVEKLISRIK